MTAVVVGGGFAGLLAARILADHYDRVIVLERGTPSKRRTVASQANHLHVLLQKGREILEKLFPGLDGELAAAGAPEIDWGKDTAWLNPFGWAPQFPTSIRTRSCSRTFLEERIRERVIKNHVIKYLEEALVECPAFSLDGRRVSGVWYRTESVRHFLPADLVVLAHANQNSLTEWLGKIPIEKNEAVVGYASCRYQLPPSVLAGSKQLYVQLAPPLRPRGGVICPVENGEYIVTLLSCDGKPGPTNELEFLKFSKGLPTPRFFEALLRGIPLSPFYRYQLSKSSWLKLGNASLPEGVVVIGDAVCSLNPVYGQGMTMAALEVEELAARVLKGRTWESGFQKAVDELLRVPWELAGSENKVKGLGLKKRCSQLIFQHALRMATQKPKVHRSFLEVMHMMQPPIRLMRSLVGLPA